jgi:hypothetical protein
MSRTVSDNVEVLQSITPKTGQSSDVNGNSIDTKDIANDDLQYFAVIGSVDDADGDETYTLKVQESSDDGNSDAFADTGDEITIDRSNDDDSVRVGQVLGTGTQRERYLRLVLVTGGTTPSIDIAAGFNLKRRSQPVNSN